MSSNSGVAWPYLRRIEAIFSGLSNVYVANGSQNNAHIVARIRKNIQGIPPASEIIIHNLSEDTRNAVRRDTTKVEIRAGWEGGGGRTPARCFYGSLFSVVHNRVGPDIVTSIQAVSIIEDIARADVLYTWNRGSGVRDIVVHLANALASRGNITVDPARIVGVEGAVGFKGWSHADSARAALDMLGRECGFSWTIIDGVFQAVGDDASLGPAATLKDPYLIEVNPTLSGPLQNVDGVRARCAFDPNLNPARDIRIVSSLSDRYADQSYRIASVVHSLDCFSESGFVSEVSAFAPLA